MIQPVNAVTAPKSLKAVQPVAKISKQDKNMEAELNDKNFFPNMMERVAEVDAIDKRQNDEVLFHLDYIGKQLQGILNAKAGKEVHVDKIANRLESDDKRTKAQKTRDEQIIELGYIGDVLKKINDVENGKLEEKPSKQSKRVRV